MNAWRTMGMGALCAAFAWGCEERQTAPEVADRPVFQAPEMSAPQGERSAASAETLRRGEGEEPQARPDEVPWSRQIRKGEKPAPGDEAAAGGAGVAGQQPLDQSPGGAGQPGTGTPQQRAQDAAGGAGEEGVRDDHTTLILPGPGAHLEPEVFRDAERATGAAREDAKDERVVVANVEFGGRLQEVDGNRVVVSDQEGNLYQAQLEEGSRLMRGGEAVTAEQLRQGTDVRASLDLVEGGFVVRELEQGSPRR